MATPNNGIPYVPENTEDPAAGLNLSLNVIDALLQTAVLAMDLTSPPGSPSDGDRYIVATGASGAWAGQDDSLARYVAEGDFWQFFEAGTQVHMVLNYDDGAIYGWTGSAWGAAGGIPEAPIDGTGYVRKNGDWEQEAAAVAQTQSIIVACSDETTNLTTGTAKVTFRMPYAFTLTAVRASLSTAQTAGSIFTVDINEDGASILSTKLTIDNNEKTSTTAATAPVISDSSLADDAEITIDIDQVGTAGAKGLKVALIGYPT